MEKNIENDDFYYGFGMFFWELVKVFFWALIIIMPIRIFLFQPFFVQGASMEPNFEDGDYLIVNELGYKITDVLSEFGGPHLFTVNSFRELDRYDVVVFKYPRDPKQFFIKRVIGLPGETIVVENGGVTIINRENQEGIRLDEKSYLPSGLVTNGAIKLTLKRGEYFVLGDNRMASHDSRAFGVVPENDIVGKVLVRAWPVNKAGIF